VLLSVHVATLDALGKGDLEVGRQQGDAPDRAQVEAQRVQRRLDREIQLGLLRCIRVAPVGAFLARLGGSLDSGALGGDLATVGADDVDAVLGEVGVKLLDLLLGDLDLLQRGGDVVECQEAALLAVRDEATELVELIDGSLVRQQNFVLDRSAPLEPRNRMRARPSPRIRRERGLVSDST
jgi:hypothetical protein